MAVWLLVMIPGVYFMLKHTVRIDVRRLLTCRPPKLPTSGPHGRNAPSARAVSSNLEIYSWLFMRVSGIVLILLVLGHLFIMNILDGGVQRINFAFVAGRWTSPFWQVWDLLMLWLASCTEATACA